MSRGRLLGFACCATLLLTGGFAAESAFSASAEAAYVSRYVFRGIKLGGAAVQPAVTATFGDVDLGFWANQPTAAAEDLERDYTFGYSFSALGIDWRGAAQLYTYPQAEVPLTRHTHEFSLAGKRSVWSTETQEFAISAIAAYDVRLDALTLEATAEHTFTIGRCGITTAATAGQVSAYNLTPDAGPPKLADSYTYLAAKIEGRCSIGTGGYLRVGSQWDTTKGLDTGGEDLSGNVSTWVAVGWEW